MSNKYTISLETIRELVVRRIDALEGPSEEVPQDLLDSTPLSIEKMADNCKKRIQNGQIFSMASNEILVATNARVMTKNDHFSSATM